MPEEPTQLLSADIRRGAGHYEILGETYAKFEFFENGWNPYTRFLDVDKVDLILRRRHQNRPFYREVQVKYGKLYPVGSNWERALFDYTSWRFFRRTSSRLISIIPTSSSRLSWRRTLATNVTFSYFLSAISCGLFDSPSRARSSGRYIFRARFMIRPSGIFGAFPRSLNSRPSQSQTFQSIGGTSLP